MAEHDLIQITCSPTASAMVMKLVNQHGFATQEAALEAALERLLEDVESPEDHDLVSILKEAEEELDRGSRGIPVQQAFDAMYREFGIKATERS